MLTPPLLSANRKTTSTALSHNEALDTMSNISTIWGNTLPIDGGTEPLLDDRCEREGVYVVADVRDSKDDPESACVSWKVQWQSGRPDSLSIREYVSDLRGIFVAWTGCCERSLLLASNHHRCLTFYTLFFTVVVRPTEKRNVNI
ncbi:hypothetical protein TNCT_617131 [Trichonephila clavata]|uniref:Uncharacterized protein n=1 Tax=Trichonephila clavata TaxID=2740835 RepID=A0A8X6FLH6_TRICU|nr:hypothetical protein TNCT_617131 [Trichonephila clavata]